MAILSLPHTIFLFKKCETGILNFPDSHNVNPENVNTENVNPENVNPELCESGQYPFIEIKSIKRKIHTFININ